MYTVFFIQQIYSIILYSIYIYIPKYTVDYIKYSGVQMLETTSEKVSIMHSFIIYLIIISGSKNILTYLVHFKEDHD